MYLLLVVAPLGGVRVVCIDGPARPAARVPATGEDCAVSCALRAAPGSDTTCAWGQGSPRLMLVATDAVPPPDVPAFGAWRALPLQLDIPTIYDDPSLTDLSPPPRG